MVPKHKMSGFRLFGIYWQLWPSLITLPAVLLMLVMCGWQLQRLSWKESLIHHLNQMMQSSPAILDSKSLEAYFMYSIYDAGRHEAEHFSKVELWGNLIEKPIFINAKYHKSNMGYHVIMPIRLHDGGVILANFGWLPKEEKSQFKPEWVVQSDGAPWIGMLRIMPKPGFFTPDNAPEKDQWFYYDADAMQEALGLEFYPVVVDIIGKVDPSEYPIPASGNIELRNDHLGYAFTWFGMAIAMMVIYVLYHRRLMQDEKGR